MTKTAHDTTLTAIEMPESVVARENADDDRQDGRQHERRASASFESGQGDEVALSVRGD